MNTSLHRHNRMSRMQKISKKREMSRFQRKIQILEAKNNKCKRFENKSQLIANLKAFKIRKLSNILVMSMNKRAMVICLTLRAIIKGMEVKYMIMHFQVIWIKEETPKFIRKLFLNNKTTRMNKKFTTKHKQLINLLKNQPIMQ